MSKTYKVNDETFHHDDPRFCPAQWRPAHPGCIFADDNGAPSDKDVCDLIEESFERFERGE